MKHTLMRLLAAIAVVCGLSTHAWAQAATAALPQIPHLALLSVPIDSVAAHPRWPGRGIYAFFASPAARERIRAAGLSVGDDGLVYIGKTNGSFRERLSHHRTGASNLGRSLRSVLSYCASRWHCTAARPDDVSRFIRSHFRVAMLSLDDAAVIDASEARLIRTNSPPFIMLIGYARVSTGEQTTAAQVAALKTSGCERIFRDNASGGRWDRPELHKLLSQLRKGDVLVVWTLDRLSRSLRDVLTIDVLTIMERVQERHAGFRSLKEAVDTTTPAGRMMMQMVGAFAEFERAMLKERTKAGLDAARKEGRIGGRPPKLKPHQQQEIVTLVKQGKKTAADAARLFGVHPATVSRLLRRT